MRGRTKPRNSKAFGPLPQGELLSWLCGGVAFLILAGWAWILKGPTAEQMAGDPGVIKDYFHGFWSGWTPQYLLGRSETLLNVGFLSIWLLGFVQMLASPLVGDLGGIKIVGLLFAALSAVSMYFFLRTLTPNKKTAALGGFLYVTMPSIIVRAVMYEHVGVSLAFVFVPLLLRGLWILTQTSSPREIVLLGLSAAGLSLSYTKMAVTILPMLLVWAGFCLIQSKVHRLRIFLSYLSAGLVASLAGLTILLPAFHESRLTAVFAFDPMEAWQKHYSFKTPLAWIDLSKFLLPGAGPDFEGDSQFFFIGAVPLIGVVMGLGSRGLSVWRQSREGRWFLVLLSCWLMTLWMAAGPRGVFGNQIYMLSSSQAMKDYALPLVWAVFLGMAWMVWKVLVELTEGGRVMPITGLLIFLFVPVFNLLSKLPFLNDIRGPESFWSISGYTCLVAATALVAVPILTLPRSSELKWRPWIFSGVMLIYFVHLVPVYSAFWKGGIDPNVLKDYESAADFLKTAPREGRIQAVSSRYFYLTIPAKTGRGLSTESLLRHFQLKWVRSLEVASQGSGELLQRYLNFAGVAYLWVDKADPSIPPELLQSYQQVFPLVYANNSVSILENRGGLFPGFLAHDYVAFSKDSYPQAGSILQLSKLNFLGVEIPNPDSNETGLAGISKGGDEVELTPAYRDRPGRSFQILTLQNPRAVNFGAMRFSLPEAQDGGWVVATEAWHPDWRAFVDDVEKPTTKAAAGLLGVRVEPGNRRVDFRFVQPFWYAGLILVGVFSWALACIALVTFQSRCLPEEIQNWWDGENPEIPQDRTVEIKTKKSEPVKEKGGNQGPL
jgi:hypothetical protein